jgi:hypothetical protein
MEKLSFINYVNKKEEKLKEKAQYYMQILQKGGQNKQEINLKTVQKELLKLKIKLDNIKAAKKDVIIDPYNNLKELIDSLNIKVNNIDQQVEEIQGEDKIIDKSILNKINDINILLDSTAANYSQIQVGKTYQFLKEKVDPKMVSDLFDKYIKDTQQLVNDLKIQIGKGESLIDNEEIGRNIKIIEQKIADYNKAIEPISNLELEIKAYIKEMESLMEITIDNFIPVETDSVEKIRVVPIDGDNLKFSFFEPEVEVSDTSQVEQGVKDKYDEDLIDSKFLSAKEKNIVEVLQTSNTSEPSTPSSQSGSPTSQSSQSSSPKLKIRKPRSNTPIITPNPVIEQPVLENSPNKAKYQSINTKYTVEPIVFNLITKPKELNKTMTDLYGNWRRKMLDFKEQNKIIQPFIVRKEKLDKISENVLAISSKFGEASLINITPEFKAFIDTNKAGLQTTMEELEQTNKVCKQIIREFNLDKQPPEEFLTKQCKLPTKLNYDDVVKDYNTKLSAEISAKKIMRDGMVDKRDKLGTLLVVNGIAVRETAWIKSVVKNKSDNQLPNIYFIKCLFDKGEEKMTTTCNAEYFINFVSNFLYKLKNPTRQEEKNDLITRLEAFQTTSYTKTINAKSNHLKFTTPFITGPYSGILHNLRVAYENLKTASTQAKRNLYKEITNLIDEIIIEDLLDMDLESQKAEISSQITKLESLKIGDQEKIEAEKNKYFFNNLFGGNINLIGGANMGEFFLKLNDFEKVIRDMVSKRKIVIMLIKQYNVRYTQFYHFQKYIVNYVSLTLAQKEYEYYNYLSKGTISFYESILKNMEQIIDKYENPKYFKDPLLNIEKNKLLYGRHYFMIKILKNFFTKLYSYWDTQFSKDKINWELNRKIDIEAEPVYKMIRDEKTKKLIKTKEVINFAKGNGIGNKKYFFLFNIFFKMLDAYHMNLPPVANYLRINYIPENLKNIDTFEKKIGEKNLLSKENIDKCSNLDKDPSKTQKVDDVSRIKFNEIFDPDNFKENSNLSLYMGLGNRLSEGKSIMLLTYGYSGVGKTFTLFGSIDKSKPDAKPNPGLLQTTLNNITDYEKIEVKAFELYGLGVPYKFYWQKEGDNPIFDHYIYNYTISKFAVSDPVEKLPEEFPEILNKNLNYQEISKEQIDNFSLITSSIDNIRKANGRIRPTINNPESSRSIMIYDFKITFGASNDKPSDCRFVVLDLPGKENLYQTYCDSTKNETSYNDNDKYRPREEFFQFRAGPNKTHAEYRTSDPKELKNYNLKMIKTMMYINPLWLATIPEIAEHFDDIKEHLKSEGLPVSSTLKSRKLYQLPEKDSSTRDNLVKYVELLKKRGDENKIDNLNEFTEAYANSHLQGIKFGTDYNKFEGIGNIGKLNLGLNGMFERCFIKILDCIKDLNGKSKLKDLGDKINDMLADPEARKQKYGYAGLEGIYINENILGLLEVLSEKIQSDRLKESDGEKKIVHVVCAQNEIYRKLLKDRNKLLINYNLISKKDFDGESFKPDATAFVQDDEFYSQIYTFRHLIAVLRGNTTDKNSVMSDSFFKASASDNYNTVMRHDKTLEVNGSIRGLSENIDDIKNNWINNYDYNKIYNLENPPIKSILKDYLQDESFRNFYLFFVVSNNLKMVSKTDGLETCDKQIQLLYDTRYFMDVIANENPEGIKNCSA